MCNVYIRIRVLVQVMFYCGEVGKPPKNPSKLNDCFLSWLSKLSTHLGPPGAEIAVIIIDNADLIMVCVCMCNTRETTVSLLMAH